MLLATPACFMDDHPQQHLETSRYRTSHHQPEQEHQQRTTAAVSYQDKSLSDAMTAERQEYVTAGAAVLPPSSSQELLGLVDLPPSTTGGTDMPGTPAPTVSFPRGRHHPTPQYPHHFHYLHHHHQHHHHHFNRSFGSSGSGSGAAGGNGATPGEDDFEFLRNILLEAGDGAAHAAQHSHSLRPLGSGGGASDSSFASGMGTKPPLFPSVTTTAPPVLSSVLPPPPSMSPALVGAVAAPDGSVDGGECMNPSALYRSSGGDGCAGGGYGNNVCSGGGSLTAQGTRRYHVTEEERIQAADDVAQCIWLAGDELREVLLSRMGEVWGKVEEEMEAASVGSGRATADSSLSSPPSKKSFNETLLERLKATCKAVEAEFEAAKVRGDPGALFTRRTQHWRGGAALRNDVLARLEAYKRNNQQSCGKPGGSGHGRFMRMHCMDDLERLAVGDGGAGRYGGASAGSVELKHELNTALEATRGAIKSELLAFGDDGGRAAKIARHGASMAKLVSFYGDGGVVSDGDMYGTAGRLSKSLDDGREDGTPPACAVGEQAAPAVTGGTRKKNGGGGGTAATAGGTKKRKRSGNGRRCKHEGCLLHPHFGLTRPEYCSKHKLPGMFNVKGRRCVHQDCTRTPVYGKSGDPHPTYCAAHKPAGYVDIKNPTCRDPSCSRQPSFGSASDRKATYCASHMLAGMVNVRRMLASFKSASLNAGANGAGAGPTGGVGTRRP